MEKLCPNCDMPFDWPGVTEDGEEYCCAECAAGLECTCAQHDHRSAPREEQLKVE